MQIYMRKSMYRILMRKFDVHDVDEECLLIPVLYFRLENSHV